MGNCFASQKAAGSGNWLRCFSLLLYYFYFSVKAHSSTFVIKNSTKLLMVAAKKHTKVLHKLLLQIVFQFVCFRYQIRWEGWVSLVAFSINRMQNFPPMSVSLQNNHSCLPVCDWEDGISCLNKFAVSLHNISQQQKFAIENR